MPFIKCLDGVVRSYAEYEDNIKPLWREQMKKNLVTKETKIVGQETKKGETNKPRHLIIGSGVVGKAMGR